MADSWEYNSTMGIGESGKDLPPGGLRSSIVWAHRPAAQWERKRGASRREFLKGAGIIGALAMGVGTAFGIGGIVLWNKWNRESHAADIAEAKKTLASYEVGYVYEGEIIIPAGVTVRKSTVAPAAGRGDIPPGGEANKHKPIRLSGNVFLVKGDDIEPVAADSNFWVVWVADDFSLRFASLHAINTASDLRESGGHPIDPTRLTFGSLTRTVDGGFQLLNPERGAIPLNFPNLG